eukprot:gb/GEZN01018251.1/.p1 GENE.gb/GEZN01018251.1/~~gb/GEZN01018251.1/.p1  ORF type:complete len:166 (-),score=26.82 gb/GEZN01018251.1/:266-733(-)
MSIGENSVHTRPFQISTETGRPTMSQKVVAPQNESLAESPLRLDSIFDCLGELQKEEQEKLESELLDIAKLVQDSEALDPIPLQSDASLKLHSSVVVNFNKQFKKCDKEPFRTQKAKLRDARKAKKAIAWAEKNEQRVSYAAIKKQKKNRAKAVY